ncbi:hypothetical protein [Limibacterium fermenti]|uniref:hypothetical protein n=1 Tax=Limibacterium fermenti TaxID=3229863 RepID=UPI003A796371
MNLTGFVQALLINVGVIAGLNDPQYKVTPVGFLNMLLENPATTQISNLSSLQQGMDREIKLRYLQRGLESSVTDRDDCDTPIGAVWKETSLGSPLYSKIGLFIPDSDFRKYQEEASRTLSAGTPSAPLMTGLYNLLLTQIQAMLQKIDGNLVSAQATKFGVNVVTGKADATAVNFATTISQTDGITKILSDFAANEMVDIPILVGNGAVNNWQLAQGMKTGVDQGGFGASKVKFYNDFKTSTLWGANHFGVFSEGTVGLVDYNKNVGAFAGQKGASIFFTLPIPVQLANGTLTTFKLDAQLKYEDCPIYDAEGAKIADRGWKVILSKYYGLFNLPADAFATGDKLAGVNGSFRYVGASA